MAPMSYFQVNCAMDEEGRFDGTPYGYDPTFMSFSSLYNGNRATPTES